MKIKWNPHRKVTKCDDRNVLVSDYLLASKVRELGYVASGLKWQPGISNGHVYARSYNVICEMLLLENTRSSERFVQQSKWLLLKYYTFS